MDIIPDPQIQALPAAWYQPHVRQIDMLRLDKVHPVVSGNKWYKLKHNIARAQQSGHSSILTFGGGYSNHLVATAAAAKAFGIRSVGIVRGVYDPLTPTLEACAAYGMQLVFVSRDEYAKKNERDWLQLLEEKYDDPFIIPEGGANEWGREGAKEIASYIPQHYTHICLPVGTGTTLAGIRSALPAIQQIWGYAPMKNGKYLEEEIRQLVPDTTSWQVFDEWHFGGFGKWTEGLITFMNEFYTVCNIPLDMVYTAKMMFGVQQQLKNNIFPRDASVLCIHTGGLQGNAVIAAELIY